MSDLIDNLKRFNRKERFFLVGMALGNESFQLSDSFRRQLGELFGIDLPDRIFCAMDYHIDWIFACLYLAFHPEAENTTVHQNHGQLTGSQEDIDFVIAYREANTYHLIFLEAKGVTSWSNAQLQSKIQRLQNIFTDTNSSWRQHVEPHFAIISPAEPEKVLYGDWPHWIVDPATRRFRWLRLRLPAELDYPTRCGDDGTPSRDGRYWKVIRKQYK